MAARLHEERFSVRAVEFWAKACDGGMLEGCSPSPGIYVTSDRLILRDVRRIAASYQHQCEASHGTACTELGDIYAGLGSDDGDYGRVTRDFAKARQWYERGCALKSLRACVALGGLLAGGQGGPKDPKREFELYVRACDMNERLGCFMLGELYRTGEGVHKDLDQAHKLYEKACALHEDFACEKLFQPLDRGQAGGRLPNSPRSSE